MLQLRPVLTTLAFALCSFPAAAQWTVTALQPTSYYFDQSWATGVHNGQVVGWIRVNGQKQATVWRSGTVASWEFLHSPFDTASEARETSGDQQVGYITLTSGYTHPAVWSGSLISRVDLLPASGAQGSAFGVRNGQQVGYVVTQGIFAASLWRGTSASWVNLHPIGATFSTAMGVDNGQQVGSATFAGVGRASLWRGTAGSRVDLYPSGATSSGAGDVHAGVQVGGASFGQNDDRPGLWRGAASSWVNLLPDGGTSGSANAVYAGRQVGWVNLSGARRAVMWRGTAASCEVLPVPFNFGYAEALGIWSNATTIMVCGYANNRTPGVQQEQALLWTRPHCVADQDDGSGLGNPDDGVTIEDLLYMLTAYAAGHIRADMDNGSGTGVPDGGVTIEDLLYFLTRYEAGC